MRLSGRCLALRPFMPGCLALGLALGLPLAALAQQLPSAGGLLQQLEQGRTLPLPKPQARPGAVVPPEMKAMPGPTVTVKTFRFVGNQLLSEDRLREAVRGYLNRPLSFSELQDAAVAVARTYREAGWIVRAYLPRQDVSDGQITVQIVEALFGGAFLDGQAPQRVSAARLLGVASAAQPVGAPANSEALERALLLLADLPGVAASGQLKAGPREGETSLVLTAGDAPLATGEIGLDNGGSRASGANRLLANLNLNSPAGLADQASLSAVHTQGSDYARLTWTLPLGYDGWRIGINGSQLNYRLIAPEFAGLEVRGTSTTTGLEATYPLLRGRLRNLYLQVSADRKRFDNQALGMSTSHYGVNTCSLGLSGNLFDTLGGGGANSASLSLVTGSVDLNGSANQAADALSTRTAGSFNKWRYALSRQQVIRQDLSLHAALSGQWASKNLDSAEKFYLGGANGVRAYPAGEGGGSEGTLANLELRFSLAENLKWVGFYDWGRVRINRDNSFAGATSLNDYSLRGAGLALAWQALPTLSLKASWAHRLGKNPNPTPAGLDQDGSLIKDRLWLQASLSL